MIYDFDEDHFSAVEWVETYLQDFKNVVVGDLAGDIRFKVFGEKAIGEESKYGAGDSGIVWNITACILKLWSWLSWKMF